MFCLIVGRRSSGNVIKDTSGKQEFRAEIEAPDAQNVKKESKRRSINITHMVLIV